ncbi:MAG TPA: thioesterase family protein [Candidatus Acidoferrum sp.]|nr:thioesterase family protein [Candidatus Acidoferrum sp.]
MEEPVAFYRPGSDGVFASTPATAGPWGPESQHGGPPAALLVRAFELTEPQPPSRIARLAMEFLRPVPVAPLTVRTTLVRRGRKASLLRGVVEAGGQEVLLAHAWRLSVPEEPAIAVPDAFTVPPIPVPAPTAAWPGAYMDGYMSAIEWRTVVGSLGEPGPGVAWTRARLPLVAGEATSPFARAALVADSGSGVSASVDFSKWLCINVDLTVSLHRDPAGEWVLLDSVTVTDPRGTGLAVTRLADENGAVGRALQTLVVDRR